MAMLKTTILQVIPELQTGGAELSTLEITDAVVKAGGKALIITEGGRLENKIIQAGGEIIQMPVSTKNPIQIFKNARRIAKLAAEAQVDLIHARSRAPAWSAFMAARRTKLPFVTTYHGAYSNTGPLKNKYNSVMARGDIVIANSEYTADLIRKQHSPEEAKLRVIHRGVDPTLYSREYVSEERINKLRTKWGIQDEQQVILKAARLTKWKGQETLIEAAAKLAHIGLLENKVIILAGDAQGRDEYRTHLEQMILDHNLGKYIKLVGHCDDVQAAFALAHLTVVASNQPEAFGRAAVEAQVSGCPVIVTNIGATYETVLSSPKVPENQATGWKIPPSDPEKMAESLEQALNLSPESLKDMGLRAQEHVKKNFTLDLMRQKTLKIYDELIGSNLSHM